MIRISVACAALLAAASAAGDDTLSPAATGTWPVEAAEGSGYPYDVPYGGYPPGGYERRIGSPYYWSVPGGTASLSATGAQPAGYSGMGPAGSVGCGCNKGSSGPATAAGPVGYGAYGPNAGPGVYGAYGPNAGYAGSGSGYEPVGGPAGDPYTYHFGPGFYRSNEFGHYRFPYYSYRRPWYDVGHPVRVRDTNLPW